ncbi:MAG: FAD-dependent oxidoreductase [Candidatus Saccharimonas sp.]
MTKIKFLKSYDEVSNIRTFVFETGGATWQPGQYQVFVLDNVAGEEGDKQRFFTIASAPSENEIHISTRVSASDFKQALNSMKPGDEIEAHGLEGDFTWENDEKVILIAAGIGVTPYRSMILERGATGRSINAHVIYFGRDDNLAFRKEFDAIAAKHPELKMDYIIGEHISADVILAHAPEATSMPVYLSGPEPMVETVGEELIAKGVNLKQDWFPGYTDQTY